MYDYFMEPFRGKSISCDYDWRHMFDDLIGLDEPHGPHKNFPLALINPSYISKEIEKHRARQIAELKIEYIGDDIMADVVTKLLKEPPLREAVSIYKPIPDYKGRRYFADKAIMDKHGNFEVTIDSYVFSADVGNKSVWKIFCMRGINFLKNYSEKLYSSSKYVKVAEKFNISAAYKEVLHFQLICNVRCAKCFGGWYKKGDVVTIAVVPREVNLFANPSPSLISVHPEGHQTYIPMMPKQKLQIITDVSTCDIEFANSPILKYMGRSIYADDVRMRADLFDCKEVNSSQYLIFVNNKESDDFQTVHIIDACDNNCCPYIINPSDLSMIYVYNINGFIIRTYQTIKVSIDDASLQLQYTRQMQQFSETKVVLNPCKSPICFILERKKQDEWVLRAGSKA